MKRIRHRKLPRKKLSKLKTMRRSQRLRKQRLHQQTEKLLVRRRLSHSLQKSQL